MKPKKAYKEAPAPPNVGDKVVLSAAGEAEFIGMVMERPALARCPLRGVFSVKAIEKGKLILHHPHTPAFAIPVSRLCRNDAGTFEDVAFVVVKLRAPSGVTEKRRPVKAKYDTGIGKSHRVI